MPPTQPFPRAAKGTVSRDQLNFQHRHRHCCEHYHRSFPRKHLSTTATDTVIDNNNSNNDYHEQDLRSFIPLLTGDGREQPEEHRGVVPGGEEAEAFLQQHQAHKQHDGTDGRLVDDGADEGDQAEPRQEQVEEAVDEAVAGLGSRLLVGRVPEVHDGAEGRPEQRRDHRTHSVGDHALRHGVGIACSIYGIRAMLVLNIAQIVAGSIFLVLVLASDAEADDVVDFHFALLSSAIAVLSLLFH